MKLGDYTRYESMNYAELSWESEELRCAISNERMWQKGSDDFDDIWMHGRNIAELERELDHVSNKMRTKFLHAVAHFSDELGDELDADPFLRSHADKLVYCYENNKDLIDFDFWCRYELLVDEKISYDEYLAIDSEFDGDPHDVEPEDVDIVNEFKDSLHKHKMSKFVFDDELMFGQDKACETVDGYVWATDELVNRMKKVVEYKHTPEEVESFNNINFYPIYNCWSCTVEITGSYLYLNKEGLPNQDDFNLPLSDSERAALIDAMEAYCERTCGCRCTAYLNEIRVEEGLEPISDLADKLAKSPGLDEKIDDAEKQREAGLTNSNEKIQRGDLEI